MTIQEIKIALKMLNAAYGRDFYRDVDEEDVIKVWAVQFAKADPNAVMEAIQNCISTSSYRPNIADIKKRMSANRMGGQLTTMEAFQVISQARMKSRDRDTAIEQYNALPPILRKLVGRAGQLRDWYAISDEAFQTVIMSAIRESYRELAQRESDYHALPEQLKTAESWMIDAPTQEALPEPEVTKSVDDILRESYEGAAAGGMTMTEELREKNAAKVEDFLKPVTKAEKKLVEERDRARQERYL